MNTGTAASALVALALLTTAGCGAAQPAATASRPATPIVATPTETPTAPPATPPPTPTPVSVPDFQVMAYQGDETFGGHSGHFSAAFAAGRPVVLLYFAGL
ncbi:MAG TPA: hypothetical protein VGO86_11020 [Candidatus Dormibacteraeota bacterium]